MLYYMYIFWASTYYWISTRLLTMCHCLLVPADLTLTTETLTELFQSAKDSDVQKFIISDRYYDIVYGIGGFLGLPDSALAEIQSSYQSWAKRKEAYLDTYVHHHPCPSWKKISELLKQHSLKHQAGEVEDTYIQGMHLTQCQATCIKQHIQYGMSCSCVLEHNQ